MNQKITSIPLDERPRERLIRNGPKVLSLIELLAIVIGNGTRGLSAIGLANELLIRFGSLDELQKASVQELATFRGLGKAKAVKLLSAFEIGLRLSQTKIQNFTYLLDPRSSYEVARTYLEKETRETFLILLLNAKNALIQTEIISIGTLSETLVHPREVFYPAIRLKASSLILAHNHPSGDPTPSNADIDLTNQLIEAGNLMGISVLDHIIIGKQCYVSFQKEKLCFNNKTMVKCSG